MSRRVLTALVLAALLASLFPASAMGTMACCRGTGEACVCPLELGFARCQAGASLSPPQKPPALLPAGPAPADCTETDRLVPLTARGVPTVPLDHPEPVPRF